MKRAYFAALLRVCLYFFEQSYYAEIKLVTTFDEKRQGYIVLSSWHGFPGGLRGVSSPEQCSIGPSQHACAQWRSKNFFLAWGA